MKNLITLTFALLLLLSCGIKQQKFNKEIWNEMDDIFYANREAMVEDLLDHHLRAGMSYQEVIGLLGQHDNFANLDSNVIAYEIMTDYGWNIDPVESKVLKLSFTEDSTLQTFSLLHRDY